MLSLSDPALPEIDKVAETLFITPRTLQRKLKDECSNFRLKESLKKEIACSPLRHNTYHIAAIADVVGYADAAAFIHSFKKWFGLSPN